MARSGVFTCTRAQHLVPIGRHLAMDGVEVGGTVALDQRPRRGGIVGLAKEEDDLASRRRARARAPSAGPRTDRGRRRRAAPDGMAALNAAGLSMVQLRPMNSLRSAVHDVWRPPRSAKAIACRAMFQGLRAKIAPVAASRSVTIVGADAPRASRAPIRRRR